MTDGEIVLCCAFVPTLLILVRILVVVESIWKILTLVYPDAVLQAAAAIREADKK